MAYLYHIDPTVNCVFVQHYDSFENGEDMTQLQELLGNPNYEKNMNLVRDVSKVHLPDSYDLDFFRRNVNDKMSRTDGALGIGRRVAWVLSNAHDFKVIHQWAVISRLNLRVIERRPFRELAAAKKWLDIPESYEVAYPENK